MGQRGPLPALRIVDSETRAATSKRQPKRRVRASPATPSPPTTLPREANAEWKRITKDLDELGLLAKVDRAILTLYCEWWDRERGLKKQLDESPLLVQGSMGQQVTTPLWAMHRDAADRVERLAKELLCTPSARLRANLPEASDDGGANGLLD